VGVHLLSALSTGEDKALKQTILLSNLKPTTHECVHLVTRGHFRSRDKDGGHTIRSAVSENPTLQAVCYCVELLPIEVLHCENRHFRPSLLLWPWPDDLHIRTWPVFAQDILDTRKWTSYVKAFESYCLRYTHTYRQTDRQTRPKLYTTPLCGWLVKLAYDLTWVEWTAHSNSSVLWNLSLLIYTYIIIILCQATRPIAYSTTQPDR